MSVRKLGAQLPVGSLDAELDLGRIVLEGYPQGARAVGRRYDDSAAHDRRDSRRFDLVSTERGHIVKRAVPVTNRHGKLLAPNFPSTTIRDGSTSIPTSAAAARVPKAIKKSKVQRLAGGHPVPQKAIARFRGSVDDTAVFSPVSRWECPSSRGKLGGSVERGRKVSGMLNQSLTSDKEGRQRQPKDNPGGIADCREPARGVTRSGRDDFATAGTNRFQDAAHTDPRQQAGVRRRRPVAHSLSRNAAIGASTVPGLVQSRR